ncbi:phosphatidylserine/phosphatidylglycerophosphate/cardiolipin synthase-like enzyme/catechol 2,3-dioxygenase-like lactoylglutathione lyase family enzyme [Catenulispora sp. EB89]|uniref:phospholipase D-like domain-containing protein n=1 Tax=Catenulispora sp. EB89 TaxID=3156257 RepID=UPI0035136612
MGEIRPNVGVITLSQGDLERAVEFYAKVFGKPPDSVDADSAKFQFANTVINLEKDSAAQDAGSRVVFTIWVDDADKACRELAGQGVTAIKEPLGRLGTRRARFADPGGHIWEIAEERSRRPGETPYLDAVQRELLDVSPGLEGKVWKRTSGNALDTADGDPASWILQVPDAWGWSGRSGGLMPQGAAKRGVKNLLERISSTISRAERCVDITGFGVDITGVGVLEGVFSPAGPFPDGEFAKAMGAGLREAARKASEKKRRLQVRVLSGVLGRGTSADPKAFRDQLKEMIGDFYSAVDINVALMVTRGVTSYNHTKFIIVDGRHVIHGGINWMANFYYQDAYPSRSGVRVGFPGYGWGDWAPVTDLDLALRGPAALSAGQFVDELWTWTCANAAIPDGEGTMVRLATTNDRLDEGISKLYQGAEFKAEPDGQLDVIAVGSLGFGILKNDSTSEYRLPDVDRVEDAACTYLSTSESWMPPLKSNNETNIDRDYMTVNPDANALRTLIACADTNVVLSQQDINGFARFPLYHALFDVRLFDILAAKMLLGIKVRIVISNPGYPDYSNIGDVRTEVVQPLFDRVKLQTGFATDANRAMRENLQLAPLRVSDEPLWLNRVKYRLHSKVVLVDDKAFYIGSRNLYPDTTQDHGFIIEDAAAAEQLKTKFLDIEWHYSKAAAIYDYENPSLDTPQFT